MIGSMIVRQTTLLMLLALAANAAAGPSVVIDPELAYWKGRSIESIAAEIKANDYSEVRLACSGDPAALRDLTKALQSAEIKTWLLVNLTAVPSSGLPEGWQAWKMKLRRPPTEGAPEYLCPNNPAYLEWRRKQLVAVLSEQPFLGVDLTGAIFPSENGPEDQSDGCFCDSCIAGFKKMHPDTDATLHEKWIGFRVASIVGAVDALVSGEDGIRKKCPGVKVAVWCPGAAHAVALVNRVKPDVVVIDTGHSDWTKPNLSAAYSMGYKHIVEAIHEVAPGTPVLLRTDIGSIQESRRTRLWMSDCAKRAQEAGFADVVFHEYSLGDYIYSEPPTLLKAVLDDGKLRLVFNKRLESAAASNIGNYSLTSGQVDYARPDGSIVTLSVSGASPGLTIRVSGLLDDEAARRFHDKPARVMERAVSVVVEEAGKD